MSFIQNISKTSNKNRFNILRFKNDIFMFKLLFWHYNIY